MLTNLQALAKALGGEVSGGQVLAPGPGHSVVDRSLSVKLDSGAPDGFVTHSFAGDDPIACRDHVRAKAGLEPFKPRRASHDAVERALMAVAVAKQILDKPKGRIVAKYDYTESDGTLLYQVLRLEPKSFRQRCPDGNGGWTWKLDDRRVLYRLPELLRYPDATVFVCEGEKDADRVASHGYCSTTVAAGKWTEECVRALAGRDVMILEDNDEPGRKKALAAAQALQGRAKTIRIVSLPGLPDKGDVSDWARCRSPPRRAARRHMFRCRGMDSGRCRYHRTPRTSPADSSEDGQDARGDERRKPGPRSASGTPATTSSRHRRAAGCWAISSPDGFVSSLFADGGTGKTALARGAACCRSPPASRSPASTSSCAAAC